jgi:hypothetical protein
MKLGTSVSLPGPKPAKQVGVTIAHGLLSFDSGWQRKLYDWANANTDTSWSSLDYWEGVLGWFHSQHVAALKKMLTDERALRPNGKQHYIGHSNGCRLLLETLTANPTILLDDVHLIAPWVVRDCVSNGINKLLTRQIKRLFLYVSAGDDVLGWNLLSGRTLGKKGPTNAVPTPFSCQFSTLPLAFGPFTQINDDSQTHCSWVDPNGNRLGFNFKTFDKIIQISLGGP